MARKWAIWCSAAKTCEQSSTRIRDFGLSWTADKVAHNGHGGGKHVSEHQQPDDPADIGLFAALLPIVTLVVLLAIAVAVFGDGTTGGPAQIALISAGMLTAYLGASRGIPWRSLEQAAVDAISSAMVAILILLMVGALIGVWIASGVIPTIIYYGSMVLDPSIFYVACLLLCAVVSIAIGSSWTTAGTVGIALISVAGAMGLSLEVTAGAIISGAYFGDKLSPLSDTTNLAAGLSGTELFTHIRFLLWTTVPAFLIALIFFTFFSLSVSGTVPVEQVENMRATLAKKFTISGLLFIPLICMFLLAVRRIPPLVAIFLSILVGAIIGAFLQDTAVEVTSVLGAVGDQIETYWLAAATGFTLDSGNASLDDLLSRGGMVSMLTTIWLIISAMFFSGMMERTGILRRLLVALLTLFKKDGHLVSGAGITALAANIVTSDQYMSIVLTSRMYSDEFKRKGLDPANLSRVVEDNGTVTSALVPWNTCGAFMAGTLGVATFAYLPYCIFNLASPVVSHLYAATGFKIVKTPTTAAESYT